ncbi:CDP-alcohol phosphatidyltransferase family protein [Entomobacter blattae]|uniref:CDP-alcohol phosphatidyltransferase family protein n=1 Tax=Entomobacter blattae TaxID=2762277 RepID=UPI00193B3C35
MPDPTPTPNTPDPSAAKNQSLLLQRRLKRLRKSVRPRVKGPSFNKLVPNLLTLLGLCAGLTSIRFALNGHFNLAVIALLIAACLDGVDGRIARLLRATSHFGAEFDSLSDFLSFGVAPSLILYLWSLDHAGRYGFVPCIMFTVCMALRLARFNASLGLEESRIFLKPKYASNFFTGVPAPAGAGLALFPIFLGLEGHKLQLEWLITFSHTPLLSALFLAGTSFLLVSTLPVWSFKNFKVPAEYVLPLLLGTGGYTAILVADPWGALAFAGILYLCMLPFSHRSYLRLKKDAHALKEAPDDPPQTSSMP